MQSYLGITPPDDAHGVLQDMHWAAGLVGYFPTYTLGNLMSVQFFDRALSDDPGIPAQIERGDFSGLLAWLQERIYRHGRKYMPEELLRRVTGQTLETGPYIRYLQIKYGGIYSL
jgi:carboxypeptidase Taq